MTVIKKLIRVFWITMVLCCLLLYLFYGKYITPSAITHWITSNTFSVIIIYCLLCAVRGLFMLPVTPFIFAGILLFPNQPVLLLIISLSCILVSSIFIYYASLYMNFGSFFEKKYPDKIVSIQAKLSQSSGFYFITAWALLPFTPTDLIIYGAGSIKLPLWKVIVPVLLGEALVCAFYIFNGMELINYISSF